MVRNYHLAAPMVALFIGLSLVFTQFYGTPAVTRALGQEGHSQQPYLADDALQLTVAFTSGSYTGVRGSRTVTATVKATPTPDREVTVNIAVTGEGATLPSHPDGSVTIPCGMSSVDVTVQFQNAPGSAVLTLSVPPGTERVLRGSLSSAMVSVPAAVNIPPVFGADTPTELRVPENSDAGVIVGVVAATDPGDVLTYTLSGEGLDKFEVDSAGRIKVKDGAVLDHETQGAYSLMVTAVDSANLRAMIGVTVTVTDVDERPPAIGATLIRQNPESPTTALDVSWKAPDVPFGVPPITGYQLEFREQGRSEWNVHGEAITGTATTISGLFSNTEHELRLRSVNAERYSVWSLSGGATDMEDLVVAFDSDIYTKPAGSKIVTAKITSNPKADRTVRLYIEVIGEGAVLSRHPDGQVIVRRRARTASVPVEFQSDTGSVTLKLSLDGRQERIALGGPVTAVVSITANLPPVFSPGTETALSVPENSNAGQPIGTVQAVDPGDALTYRLTGEGSDKFEIDNAGLISVGANAELDHESKASYPVMVTVTDSADQEASIDVTISISDVSEPPPSPGSLTVEPLAGGGGTTLRVEWTAPAMPAGIPDIIGYEVMYRAQDETYWVNQQTNGQSTVVNISDLTENTVYDVQVRAVNHEGRSQWVVASGTTETGTPVIGGGSSQVPTASPPEGRGGLVIGGGANAAPRFMEGASAVRRIDENLPPGSEVGQPVIAVDNDPDDEVTYSLGGVDFMSFQIDEKSGQISSVESLDFEKQASYSVRVIATDKRQGTARIDVSIEVNNTDDAGVVILIVDETAPEGAITARLSDPDGGVSNVRWKWQSSSDGTEAWTDIPGATSDNYTPTYRMLNKLVRAVAFYADAHGLDKKIEDETAEAVLVERAQAPPPTPTSVPTPTLRPVPSPSPTLASTLTPTPEPTQPPASTPEPTSVPTLTVPPTSTSAPVPTSSPSPTAAPVPTPTPFPTAATISTATPLPTSTPEPISAHPDTSTQPLDTQPQPADANGGGIPTWAYFLALGVICGVVLGAAAGWIAGRMARR